MHLEIIQGGGISSGFPPAIASILPTIALDSFWAEYYDKVTFENVPLTLMNISFIDSGSRNRIVYSSKVRCQHPDPSNVVVAASREFLYEST